MANQAYAVTGRYRKPDFVSMVNAQLNTLPQKKSLADQKAYQDKVIDLDNRRLGLETNQLAENSRIAAEELAQNKKNATTSAVIGLGQLGAQTYYGNQKDKQLAEILDGGGKSSTGSANISGGATGVGMGEPGAFDNLPKADFMSKEGIGSLDNWKQGASNWGSIASGSLGGGAIGSKIGEAILPFDETTNKIVGGAGTAGLISYLSSGDPYTAVLSAIGGGALGGFL